MTRHISLSVIGRDRPGIVAAISRALLDIGANIENSSMTLLGGEFAMILVASVPSGVPLTALREPFVRTARETGLTVSLTPIDSPDHRSAAVRRPYVVSLYGADKPGIVYEVSSFLAEEGVNITDVQTTLSGGGDNPVYIMLLEIDIPRRIRLPSFRKALRQLADRIGVNATLNPVDSPRL